MGNRRTVLAVLLLRGASPLHIIINIVLLLLEGMLEVDTMIWTVIWKSKEAYDDGCVQSPMHKITVEMRGMISINICFHSFLVFSLFFIYA